MFEINAKIKGINGTVINEYKDLISLEYDLLYIKKEKINSYTLEINNKVYTFDDEGNTSYKSNFTKVAINLLQLNKSLIERDLNNDKDLDSKYTEIAFNIFNELKSINSILNIENINLQVIEGLREDDLCVKHISSQGNIYYIRKDCTNTDYPIIEDNHILNVYNMNIRQGKDDEDLTEYIEEMKRRNISY